MAEKLLIDEAAAREHIDANYHNDPLLQHLYRKFLDGVPKVNAAQIVLTSTTERLISADELMHYVETCAPDVIKAEDTAGFSYEAIQELVDACEMIDTVPVVHGRWIPVSYDGYADGCPVWDEWECSECQEEHSGDEDTLTPYCPNCGAKMDGGTVNV